MTTIVAIQNDDWCVIAADSQITSGNVISDFSQQGKIAINGEYLFAGAGYVRGLNIVTHVFQPPRPPRRVNLDKFMVRTFIPKLRECFISCGFDAKESGEAAEQDNEFIVAIRGKIYLIGRTYDVTRDGFKIYTTGSGGEFALGAVSALQGDKVTQWEEAVSIADVAVRTAIKFDSYSGGKVQIAVQKKTGENFLTHLDDDLGFEIDVSDEETLS